MATKTQTVRKQRDGDASSIRTPTDEAEAAASPSPAASKPGRKPRSPAEIELLRAAHPSMRRGKHRKDEQEPEEVDRQFVVAASRALNILSAFKAKDQPLGNRELAGRTGMPETMVSRYAHTLTALGFLNFDPKRETYDLGGSTLALAHTALARISLRRIAVPLLQDLADRANANVGLGIRDRNMMLYAEACEGSGPVGLRLFPGSRIPIASSAMGRAYLSAMSEAAREQLLEELAPQFGAEWNAVRRGVDRALREIAQSGFCTSIGDWQKDINGVAIPLIEPGTDTIYVINLGGPAYMLSERDIAEEHGPELLKTRNAIARAISPR